MPHLPHPRCLICCGTSCSLHMLVFVGALSDDAKADLWSAGAVLYELMTAKHPYGGANQVGAFSKRRCTLFLLFKRFGPVLN